MYDIVYLHSYETYVSHSHVSKKDNSLQQIQPNNGPLIALKLQVDQPQWSNPGEEQVNYMI